jgi:hypothetical protein
MCNYCPNCGEPEPGTTCKNCNEDILQYYLAEPEEDSTSNVVDSPGHSYEVVSRLPSGALLTVVVDSLEAYDYLQSTLNAYP